MNQEKIRDNLKRTTNRRVLLQGAGNSDAGIQDIYTEISSQFDGINRILLTCRESGEILLKQIQNLMTVAEAMS